jgi:hypothetical protein
MPPQEDDAQRRAKDLERLQREQASAQSLAASTIGNGGTLTVDGNLVINGTITTPGTLSSAGAVNAGTSMSAGTTITAGGNIQGGGLISTGGIIASGGISAGADLSGNNVQLGANGTLFSTYSYNNPVVTAYLAAYINGPDGRLGATPSALRFKQDIVTKVYTVAEAVKLSALVVNYRLKEAVEMYGEQAPTEVGMIAESLITAGFPEFVAFDAQGHTLSIHYERICLVIIGAFSELASRVAALEAKP